MRKVGDEAAGEELHAERVLSLSKAPTWVIHAAALGVNPIGRTLSMAQGAPPMRSIKQVDLLLSKTAIEPAALFQTWIVFDLGGRTDAEDPLLLRLREVVPEHVKVVLLADRGFDGVDLYEMLTRRGWDYDVRFRQDFHLASAAGETKPAAESLTPNRQSEAIRGALVTAKKYEVGAVVTMRAPGIKDSWCLTTSLKAASARNVVDLHSRKFTIEETFRDQTDARFGLGMRNTRVKSAEHRDRLFFHAALAQALLPLLSAASERCGVHKGLKPNTLAKRMLSFYKQGCYRFEGIPNMRDDRRRLPMKAFGQIVREHQAIPPALGVT